MTGCALHIRVTASQWEGCGIVIEDDVLPVARIVAPGTKRAKLTLMRVFRLMAGKAVLWCAFIALIEVAGLACHLHVDTGQLKHRKIVIEFGGRPSCRRMALRTVRTKAPLVRLIRLMTGETILGSAFEQTVLVAGRARHLGMSSRQLED